MMNGKCGIANGGRPTASHVLGVRWPQNPFWGPSRGGFPSSFSPNTECISPDEAALPRGEHFAGQARKGFRAKRDALSASFVSRRTLFLILHPSSLILLAFILCLRTASADMPSSHPSPLASRPSAPATRPSEDLRDVSSLMLKAGQRLDTGKADAITQQNQRQAIEILDRLIKQSEEQEKQQQQGQCKACGGKGCRLCRKTMVAGGKPVTPAQQSTADPRAGGPGELRSETARPGEAWGNMRPEERERILQSIGKDFPSQYRQLVEQYYKQLAKEE